MDKLTFDAAAILFCVVLPGSVFTSAVGLMAVGLFRRPEEQSLVFRLVGRRYAYGPRHDDAAWVAMAAILFLLLNAIAVFYALPVPGAPYAVGRAYFAALTLWFIYVALTAIVARNRRRTHGLDDLVPASPPAQSRIEALIDRLDLEDALESGSYWDQEPTTPLPNQLSTVPSLAEETGTTADQGEPCAVYPLETQSALILPTKFDIARAADSFQGALILELATVFEPRFPSANSPLPSLVVRSRIVRAYPGNRLARYGSLVLSLLFGVGAAVFEVESQMTVNGAVLPFVRTEGKRRWGFGFGGDSQELLADAAKLAGERAGRELLAGLAAHGPQVGFYPAPAAAQVPVFAGLGVRLASLLIDGAFLFASLIVAVVLMDQAGYQQVGNAMVYSPAALLVQWVWLSFLVAYHPVCWWHFQGTVGQLLLGLRVVRAADEAGLGLRRTTIRYLAFAICVLAVVPGLLSAGAASFDPRKQTWWDKVGDSVVVCEA